MAMNSVRRMASQLLKCGESRVRILDAAAASKALTKDDVRGLINKAAIVEIPAKRNSRVNAIFKQSRLKAGRRRGSGSLKGAKYSRISRKDLWIEKVRAQRDTLKGLKAKLADGAYKKMYSMIKGGAFKSKKSVSAFVRENDLFRQKV